MNLGWQQHQNTSHLLVLLSLWLCSHHLLPPFPLQTLHSELKTALHKEAFDPFLYLGHAQNPFPSFAGDAEQESGCSSGHLRTCLERKEYARMKVVRFSNASSISDYTYPLVSFPRCSHFLVFTKLEIWWNNLEMRLLQAVKGGYENLDANLVTNY